VFGASGGSGVCVIRYPTTYRKATAYSGTETTSGGYYYYTFTSSGSIQF
jgi:hypothetical protein